MSSSDSNSYKDTTFSSGKESSRESPKIELSIVNQSKDVCEGPNNSQNVQTDPNPLEDGKQISSSKKSSEDPNVVLDQGSHSSYGIDAYADSKLAGPCLSVHTGSIDGFNATGGEDLNHNVMSSGMFNGGDCLHLAREEAVDMDIKENKGLVKLKL